MTAPSLVDTGTRTIAGLLRTHAELRPDHVALNVTGSVDLTYGDWDAHSDTVARGLLANGIRRGSRIALIFEEMDWIGYAVAYLAVLKVGAVAVHLSRELPDAEFHRRLTECRVSHIVHRSAQSVLTMVDRWGRSSASLEQAEGGPVDTPLEPDDLAEIVYSSGTTGPAKAVLATHGNLTFWCSPERMRDFEDPTPRLTVSPMGGSGSATVINNLLTSPVTYTLILAEPDPERVAELVDRYRVGTLLVAPWIAIQMVTSRVGDRYDLSSVHTIASGSAPFPPAIATRLLDMMPQAQLHIAYSGSQVRPAVVLGTFDPRRPFALGKRGPGTDFIIADAEGREVPVGHLGEIRMRSIAPKRLSSTGEQLGGESDGENPMDAWISTGDLGYVGQDDDLHFFDRVAHVIRSGGRIVSSTMVEAALYEHHLVKEAAVIGLDNRDGTQAVVAVVVLAEPGALASLREFVSVRLPVEERPAHYYLLDKLPRDALGKVLKKELRKRFAAPDGLTEMATTGVGYRDHKADQLGLDRWSTQILERRAGAPGQPDGAVRLGRA